MIGLLVSLRFKYIYVLQVARQPVQIESETYYELLGDFETYEVGGYGFLQRFGLEQQRGYAHLARLLRLQVVDKVIHRIAGIDNILDDNHRAVLDVLRQAQHLFYLACRAGALVAFKPYECYFGIGVKFLKKLRGKRERAGQYAEKEGRPVAVTRSEFATHFLNTRLYCIVTDKRLKMQILIDNLIFHNLDKLQLDLKSKNLCKVTKK